MSVNEVFETAYDNRSRVGEIGNTYDISMVKFPDVDGYGSKHALATQRLAEYLGRNIFKLTPAETRVIGIAAILHDVARTQPFAAEDPGHRVEGLSKAASILETHPQFKGHTALHQNVLRLLANHNLDAAHAPTDPAAVALWDADTLESLRHLPNTGEGRRRALRRLDRAQTAFAKHPATVARYAKHCGWTEW